MTTAQTGTGTIRRTACLAVLALVVGTVLPRSVAAAAPSTDPPATAPAASRAFVDNAFSLFLDRAATEAEMARWEPTVAWGDRAALARALARSREWAAARIEAQYERILRRTADPSGRDFWVAEVASGRTLEDVAASLYGSDEYFGGAGSSAGFVDRLYADLLGRSADQDGRQYWVDVVDDGVSRDTVAAGFFDSFESRRDRVEDLFRVVLSRTPDPDGLRYWMAAVRTLGDAALASSLAASDEFYVRVTGVQPPPPPSRGTGTGFAPYAVAGDVVVSQPAMAVDLIGFHESNIDGARQQNLLPGAAPARTLPTRSRGTGSRSAADIVVPPEAEIRSPVTGTVLEARSYVLYCEYTDHLVEIEPDDHPGWVVRVLHLADVEIAAGDRVVAGITAIAPGAHVLPFASQVEEYTASPPWPHVHVDVIDPSIPDRPGEPC